MFMQNKNSLLVEKWINGFKKEIALNKFHLPYICIYNILFSARKCHLLYDNVSALSHLVSKKKVGVKR